MLAKRVITVCWLCCVHGAIALTYCDCECGDRWASIIRRNPTDRHANVCIYCCRWLFWNAGNYCCYDSHLRWVCAQANKNAGSNFKGVDGIHCQRNCGIWCWMYSSGKYWLCCWKSLLIVLVIYDRTTAIWTNSRTTRTTIQMLRLCVICERFTEVNILCLAIPFSISGFRFSVNGKQVVSTGISGVDSDLVSGLVTIELIL